MEHEDMTPMEHLTLTAYFEVMGGAENCPYKKTMWKLRQGRIEIFPYLRNDRELGHLVSQDQTMKAWVEGAKHRKKMLGHAAYQGYSTKGLVVDWGDGIYEE